MQRGKLSQKKRALRRDHAWREEKGSTGGIVCAFGSIPCPSKGSPEGFFALLEEEWKWRGDPGSPREGIYKMAS